MSLPLRRLVDLLLEHFGPQGWWPAETPFEVMIGAILTQNTAWGNVERAIAGLKDRGLMTPRGLLGLSEDELAEAVRPTGYFRQKAKKLLAFLRWFAREHNLELDSLRGADPQALRRELLGIWGIGPETADSILCYAVGLPFFVVDAFTVRVLARHGFVGERPGYDDVQALAHRELPRETPYLNEAHALFVAAGKHYCRKKKPLCDSCPLKPGS